MEQAFSVQVNGVKLPKSIKRKWEQAREAASTRSITLENLEIKLQAAEQRRENLWEARRTKATRYRVRTVHDPSAALERLEKRLAAAEAKRQAVLHAVRLRAAVTASRAAAVARAEAARRRQLKHRLEQSLEAAEVARAAHLANTAARAARISSRAHTNARVAKQREQTEAASRLTTLLHRMKRATAIREQVIAARKDGASSSSSVVAQGSPVQAASSRPMQQRTLSSATRLPSSLGNTVQGSTDGGDVAGSQFMMGPNAGEWLRRQAAARRVQNRWRTFAVTGTTQSLASAFLATGIPFSVALQEASAQEQGSEECGDEGEEDLTRQGLDERYEDEEMSLPGGGHLDIDAEESLSRFSQEQTRRETGMMDSVGHPSLSSSPTSTLRPRYFAGGRTPPTNTPAERTPVDTPRSASPPPRGPITPAIPVPILTPTSNHLSLRGGQRRTNSAPVRASSAQGSTAMDVGSGPTGPEAVPEPPMAWSPSSRRQPVARLASSLAEMAAAAAHHEDKPAPRPASFHASAMSFDEFAEAMSAPATLRTAQALLRRLEVKASVKESLAGGASCEGLLRRLFPKLAKSKMPDRYPARAFLSAYMILAHPEVVLSQQGAREEALSSAAATMLTAFEALLARLIPSNSTPNPSRPSSGQSSGSMFRLNRKASDLSTLSSPSSTHHQLPLAALLRRFDETWVAYLEQFIAWKSHDAAGLEAELIRGAVDLETSRLAKIAARERPRSASNPPPTPLAAARAKASEKDIEALVQGVERDLQLIAERVVRLTGAQGSARLEAALAAARATHASSTSNSLATPPIAENTNNSSSPAAENNGGPGVDAMVQQSETTEEANNPAGAQLSLAPSPAQSPAKKLQRRGGTYAGPEGASNGPGGVPRSLSRSFFSNSTKSGNSGDGSMDTSMKSSGENTTTTAPTPTTAAQASSGSNTESLDDNLLLLWQLLYDASWQLPATELEALWKDATGETNPMTEPTMTQTDLEGMNLETIAGTLHMRVKRVAEKAFWDNISELLASGKSEERSAAVATAAGLLAEAGVALNGVLPDGSAVARDVEMQLGSAENLLQLLLSSAPAGASATSGQQQPLVGVNCTALFGLLDWLGSLLRRLGAPARESTALSAQNAIRVDLASAAASGDSSAAAVVVARALRLITVLLKLLQADMANARLSMLASHLGSTSRQAVGYARSKMEISGGLGAFENVSGEEVAGMLPHARGWLALASGRLPQVEAFLGDSVMTNTSTTGTGTGTSQSGSDQNQGTAAVPSRLQTGRVPLSSGAGAVFSSFNSVQHRGASGSSAAESLTKSSSTVGLAGPLVSPVSVRSWRGLVRCGLAQLVAGEGAVTRLSLPEPLRPDAARLQAAQNEFQRIMVLSAAFVVLQHVISSSTNTNGGTGTGAAGLLPEVIDRAKRRLSAVLAAPDVCLADVAAEVSSLAAGAQHEHPQHAQHEAMVQAMLRSMLGKSSGALRTITSGLCSALSAHLILGPGSPAAQAVVEQALVRCGAAALGSDVGALAARLGEVAAVTEAVCGPWYEILSNDLI